jgi:hypothetical protein
MVRLYGGALGRLERGGTVQGAHTPARTRRQQTYAPPSTHPPHAPGLAFARRAAARSLGLVVGGALGRGPTHEEDLYREQ